jgi:cysteinyl-tRNA synthetase
LVLKLFNSMGRTLEVFKPLTEGEVRMYTCGPTVWNYAHIGNLRTFVFEDLLRRYLEFKGYRVTQVMNITDVEDRIIKGIRQFGKTLAELTAFYEAAFMEDLATLNVKKAERYPRATAHIEEEVSLVEVLLTKGYAYRAADGSVYFDVSKFERYGSLSGVKLDLVKSTGRVSSDHYEEKKEAVDFALWKAWDPGDGEVYWETRLGKGRPGWHVECSAMSMKYLGESFDIHTGGMDNKFPHHENEIAQSEAATGKKFVNYWLHSEFLNVRGEEMHKSAGNQVCLRDLLKEGWGPQCIRFYLISARYRDSMDLTKQRLEQARAEVKKLQDFVDRLRNAEGDANSEGRLGELLIKEFEEAMDDDLNTPAAFVSVFGIVKRTNALLDEGKIGREEAGELLRALKRVDSVLGVIRFEEPPLPERLAKLVEAREEARKRRDFKEADRIRAQLFDEGIVLEDSASGTHWKRRKAG